MGSVNHGEASGLREHHLNRLVLQGSKGFVRVIMKHPTGEGRLR